MVRLAPGNASVRRTDKRCALPTIINFVAVILAVFAVGLLIPAAAALVDGDMVGLEAFGLLSMGYGFVALSAIWAVQSRLRQLSRAETFGVVVLGWLMLSAVAMVPFVVLERASPIRALFSSVSAVTTLGVSLEPAAATTLAMIIYRATAAWIGGLLTLVLVVFVMARFEVGGLPNRHLRTLLHGTGTSGAGVGRTVLGVFVPYAVLTAACAVLLALAGVAPFAALAAAFAALSTNGYLPLGTTRSLFDNPIAEIILIVFMLIGGTSIVWHRMLADRRFSLARQHSESYWFLAVAVGAGLLIGIGALVFGGTGEGAGEIFLSRLFDTVSLITTTGLTYSGGVDLTLPLVAAAVLAMAGATSYSPSGGVRFHRLGVMFAHTLAETKGLIYPHAVIAGSFGNQPSALRQVRSVWSFFFMFVVSLAVAAIVFAALGFPLDAAFSLAVGTICSVASLVDGGLAVAGGEPGPAVEMAIAVFSLIGRIELLVLLAVLVQTDW
jgi:trk/ktr system potassium uptake protein